MTRIITPGLFLVAAVLTGACTDRDEPAPPETGTDAVACCRPDAPVAPPPVLDSFDQGRRARARLDLLHKANLRR